MLEQTHDEQEIIQRVAALDIGKAELVCCVRVPDPKGGSRRMEEVTTYSTMTRSLQLMADRLLDLGVTRVVMEATSDYWRSPFYLLEAHGFQTWLVNAKDVKHLPGRPKTDRLDAVWLCKVAERQMLRPSFVPPVPIRRLRDVTRYRIALVSDRTREKNRVEKLLEDARIKLSVVASDIFGMYFTDHHRFLLAKMLTRIDALNADIDELETEIESQLAPFASAVARLDEIPGVGATAAAVIIAEVGVDMTRFPTPAHLSSWARFAPGVKESAGRKKGNGSTGHGDPYLARILGEAAVGASRTNTFLGERYRRIARRRGKKKAIVAVGRSILVIVWSILSDPETRYYDLGPGFYDSRINPDRKKRNHIRELEALGYKVTLEPAA
jgi:transposase